MTNDRLFVYICFALCVGTTFSGCSENSIDSTNTNDPEFPEIVKQYDMAKGGVQITSIAYDQGKNAKVLGRDDEWIVLTAMDTIETKGWKLDASDGQRFPLPDTLFKTLKVFTKKKQNPDSKLEYALGYGNWIWNNTNADVATLLDQNGNVIDVVSYDLK